VEIIVLFDYILLLHFKLEAKVEVHKKFICDTFLDLT